MKNFIISSGISLVGILFLFLTHFNRNVSTMLNVWDKNTQIGSYTINEKYLRDAVNYHKTQPAFARRPMSTFLIENGASLFQQSLGTSFILVNFILLFICGILIYYLSLTFKYDIKIAFASQIFFFMGFTILCAFFNTNYTYDEPMNCTFTLLALLAFLKEKDIPFFLFFLLACISREASYILVPSFLILKFLPLPQPNYKTIVKFSFGFFIVFILHFGFLKLKYPDVNQSNAQMEIGQRMSSFAYNFQDNGFAVESLLSPCLVLFFPMFLLFKYYRSIRSNPFEWRLCISFLIALVINTFVIYFFAYAREARLFALPLLLIYPILGKYFLQEIKELFYFKFKKIQFLNIVFGLIFLFILYQSYFFIFNGYITTLHPKEFNYNDEYLFFIVISVTLINLKDLFTESKLSLNKITS